MTRLPKNVWQTRFVCHTFSVEREYAIPPWFMSLFVVASTDVLCYDIHNLALCHGMDGWKIQGNRKHRFIALDAG